MPGYQPVRIAHPSEYFSKHEPIYGQVKNKKKSKGVHPLFEDIKTRDSRERMNYERYLKSREMVRGNPNGRYDSLKVMGSCSDLTHLDNFMSMPRQRHHSTIEEPTQHRLRSRSFAKSSSTVFSKGNAGSGGDPRDKRNSIHSDSAAVTAAMLSSLRSSGSEDNLYESMEMITYMKTMQNMNRAKKTRSLQKTGHPLFDHLREEQAMKEPKRKTSTTKKPFDEHALQSLRSHHDYSTSDGNSPSHSSSSSGDEYDLYPRMETKSTKHSRSKLIRHHHADRSQQPSANAHAHAHAHPHHPHSRRPDKARTPHQKKKRSEANNGSESDDEFKIIPRPKLMGRALLMHQQQQQQQQQLQQQHQQQQQHHHHQAPHRRRSDASPPSEESDSSFNNVLLR